MAYKRSLCWFLFGLLLLIAVPHTEGADELPVLITTDLKGSYNIISLVTHRAGGTEIADVNRGLQRKAQSMGADHIIEVRYFSHSGYLYGYGTAVTAAKSR